MASMFQGCSALTSVDASKWNTSAVTNMSNMFNGCVALNTIYASGSFTTAKVSNGNYMFSNCKALVGGNGTVYHAKYTNHTYAHIDAEGNPGYFTAK